LRLDDGVLGSNPLDRLTHGRNSRHRQPPAPPVVPSPATVATVARQRRVVRSWSGVRSLFRQRGHVGRELRNIRERHFPGICDQTNFKIADHSGAIPGVFALRTGPQKTSSTFTPTFISSIFCKRSATASSPRRRKPAYCRRGAARALLACPTLPFCRATASTQ
jgi:hypothetical protein